MLNFLQRGVIKRRGKILEKVDKDEKKMRVNGEGKGDAGRGMGYRGGEEEEEILFLSEDEKGTT